MQNFKQFRIQSGEIMNSDRIIDIECSNFKIWGFKTKIGEIVLSHNIDDLVSVKVWSKLGIRGCVLGVILLIENQIKQGIDITTKEYKKSIDDTVQEIVRVYNQS